MSKTKTKQWAVTCTISGRAVVFVTLPAKSTREDAMKAAGYGELDDSELIEWEIEEPRSAEVNE